MQTQITAIVLGMGLLGVILALAGSNVYRHLILENQQQAFSRLIELKADNLLQKLYQRMTELSAAVQYDPAFRVAFNQRQADTIYALLDVKFQSILTSDNNIKIHRIVAYAPDFQPIANASNAAINKAVCPQYIKQLSERENVSSGHLLPNATLCVWEQQPVFIIVVPIDNVQSLGYLLFAVDPVPYLKDIARALPMPLRIEDMGKKVLYQTDDWDDDTRFLVSKLTFFSKFDQPVVTLAVTNDVQALNQKLQKTRYWILLIALLCTLVVMLFVFVLLDRRLLQPLAHLSTHLSCVGENERLLGQKVILHGYAEINGLANCFNNMTAALKQAYESLQTQQDHLEDLVRERTQELLVIRDQALTANQAKSRFIANIGHEFRTPLNAMLGYSEILQEEAEDRGHVCYAEDLARLREASQRLLVLVNDALEVAKLETGKAELDLSSGDVYELGASLISALQPLAQKQHNNISFECDDNIGDIYADQEKVKQIVFNLLDNANKFTQAGNITLTISRKSIFDEDWFEFCIKDTGIGIPKTEMDTLFDIFTQVDDSASRRYEGTGIGLALSQRFSQLMGGAVKVSSVEGQGSEFVLSIPAEVQPYCCYVGAEKSERAQICDPSNPEQVRFNLTDLPKVEQGERRKQLSTILLFNTANQDQGQSSPAEFLTKKGFRVQVCHDNVEGLALAKTLKPNVIIFESLQMNANSWSLFQGLKRDAKLSHIPMVVLATFDDQLAFVRGVSGCVTKPISQNQLSHITTQFALKNSDTILVIEGDHALRSMMQRILEKSTWNVLAVDSGKQALTLLNEHQPGLILLDLYLSQIEDFTFVDELRKHKEWRKIPIVVISSNELNKSECMKLNGWTQTMNKVGFDNNQQQLQALYDVVVSCLRGQAKRGEMIDAKNTVN